MEHIWNGSIVNHKFLTDPSSLYFFILLSFADLKSYKFVYWYGCPSFASTTPSYQLMSHQTLQAYLTTVFPNQQEVLLIQVYTAIYERFAELRSNDKESFAVPPVCMMSIQTEEGEVQEGESGSKICIHTLQEAWQYRFQSNYYILVLDNNMLPGGAGAGASTGWGVRNLLVLLSATVPTPTASPTARDTADPQVNIVCLRGELVYHTLKLLAATPTPTTSSSSSTSGPPPLSLPISLSQSEVAGKLLPVLRGGTRADSHSVLLQVRVFPDNVFARKYRLDLEAPVEMQGQGQGESVPTAASARAGEEDGVSAPTQYRVIGWEMNEK